MLQIKAGGNNRLHHALFDVFRLIKEIDMANATPLQKAMDKMTGNDTATIEEQIAKLTADIAALTRTVAEYGSGKLETAAAEALTLKDNVAEKSAAAAQAAKDTLITAEGDLEEKIRTHPLAAVGIAAGLGFLFAVLSKR